MDTGASRPTALPRGAPGVLIASIARRSVLHTLGHGYRIRVGTYRYQVFAMMTNEQALDRIETALAVDPVCACGRGTTVVTAGDELRLVCPTLEAIPQHGIRRLLAARLELTHVSRTILRDPIVGLA